MRSPLRMAARRFFRNRLAVMGLVVLGLMVIACFIGGIIALRPAPDGSGIPRYEMLRIDHLRDPPDARFWLGMQDRFLMGTDALGRDLASRFFLGGAISLLIGLASALVAVVIGTSVGLWAGYVGGRVDAMLMRLVDILYGLPYILLVILMRVALVPIAEQGITRVFSASGKSANMWANFLVLLVGIGAVSWLTLARVVRGQVLSLRQQPFVEAARAMGFGWLRIMGRHILPNLVGTIIVYGTLTVPAAILSESFLSFLGLGVQVPLPSWGNLASDGMEALNPVKIRWWIITWPCLGLSLTLLALNFVGDGIRDAVDAKG